MKQLYSLQPLCRKRVEGVLPVTTRQTWWKARPDYRKYEYDETSARHVVATAEIPAAGWVEPDPVRRPVAAVRQGVVGDRGAEAPGGRGRAPGRHVAAGRAPGAGASRAVQPASERGREAGEERRRLAPGVDAQWRELDTRLREAAAPASALATLDALAQEWRALRKQVDDADIAAPASFERHTALVARLLLFKNTLLDDFKLSLDADLGASALIAAAYQDLPVAAETLGQVRARAAAALAAGEPGAAQRLAVDTGLARARDMGANIARNLERAGTGAPALAAQIDAAAGRVRQALDGMDELTRASLARREPGGRGAARLFRQGHRAAGGVVPRDRRRHGAGDRAAGARGGPDRTRADRAVERAGCPGAGRARAGRADRALDRRAAGRGGGAGAVRGRVGPERARAPQGRDETARLLASLNRMSEGLSGTVRQVQAGAAAIEGAAGEIAAGNHDLSRRTEEQAASLEETAASMEQFTATARQNAAEALAAGERAGARPIWPTRAGQRRARPMPRSARSRAARPASRKSSA